MDGTTVSQEETLAMFTKFTAFMDYIRNQLVNNTELARQVAELQGQITSLSSRVGEVVGQNSALQEAVNVLTKERDEERETNKQLQQHNQELQSKFDTRDNDANHWYAQYQAVSEELARVKQERSELETDHLKLTEEHDKAKAKLEQIQKVFASQMATVEELQKREGPQPRDPVTQQWRSWNQETQTWEEKLTG